MNWLIPAIFIALIPLALALGWCFLAPMSSGYKPFTRPSTAAEDAVLGTHPERRLRKRRP